MGHILLTIEGMTDYLLSPGARLEAEIERKRSRFITVIERVSTVEEARAVIQGEKERFPDARHWCTAFVVSIPGSSPVLNSSDDGEPSGTAGRPMLDVLTGRELVDVVAVVTLYFGGTLLGTGGLVSAYSDSTAEALRGAAIFERVMLPQYEIMFRHADAGRYIAALEAGGFSTSQEYLASGVEVKVASANKSELFGLVASVSSGAAEPRHIGEIAVEIPAGELA